MGAEVQPGEPASRASVSDLSVRARNAIVRVVCGEEHTPEMWADVQLLSPSALGRKLRSICRSGPGRMSIEQLLRGQRNCGRLTSAEILKWIGEPEGQRDEASVNLTFCVHCGCYTVNQQADNCACGGELDATSMNVPPGTRLRGEIVGDERRSR